MTKNLFSYYVLLTMKDGRRSGFNIRAASEKEAINQALLKGSQKGLPVFDCKIEVKR